MSVERAKAALEKFGFGDRVMTFETSSATVVLAAAAVGVEPARIAKTLSFLTREGVLLVLFAGDARVDNQKFKREFSEKARMLPREDTEEMTGYAAGGVCPFGNPDGVRCCLDRSLLRFDTVYPAAGDDASAVRLTPEELYLCSNADRWVDVSRGADA